MIREIQDVSSKALDTTGVSRLDLKFWEVGQKDSARGKEPGTSRGETPREGRDRT